MHNAYALLLHYSYNIYAQHRFSFNHVYRRRGLFNVIKRQTHLYNINTNHTYKVLASCSTLQYHPQRVLRPQLIYNNVFDLSDQDYIIILYTIVIKVDRFIWTFTVVCNVCIVVVICRYVFVL